DVYVWHHTQRTGTNSRTLRRIEPLLDPLRTRWREVTSTAARVYTTTPVDSSFRGVRTDESTGVCRRSFLGELTWMVPPVPIPNTAVKHPGPMVVLSGRE